MAAIARTKGSVGRDLLKLGAAGIVALGLGGVSWQARAAEGAAPRSHPARR